MEATHLVIYPMATSFKAMSYILQSYVGMSKEDIKECKSLGRWVCVHKHYPQYLISQHYAKVLNH